MLVITNINIYLVGILAKTAKTTYKWFSPVESSSWACFGETRTTYKCPLKLPTWLGGAKSDESGTQNTRRVGWTARTARRPPAAAQFATQPKIRYAHT